jgi:predicted component of type VI protein secretion system
MNPSLLVLSPGKWQGRVIPLLRSPFVIGRSEGCTLRPASPQIGERHCAVLLQEGKAYVQDLGEAGNTFLDDRAIQGTVEVRHGQRLRVGPLLFEVHLPQTANETAPPSLADEEAAALLLAGQTPTDDGWSITPPISRKPDDEPATPAGKSPRATPTAEDTTAAAREILKKYGKLTGLRGPKKKA